MLESIGFSIWQMALAPISVASIDVEGIKNGYSSENGEESGSEEDGSDSDEFHEQSDGSDTDRLLAAACDDGCVRLYRISDLDKLTYYRSLPRVSGETSSPPLL